MTVTRRRPSPAWRVRRLVLRIATPASARMPGSAADRRSAGPLTVYPDDARRTLFYYPPGELTIAVKRRRARRALAARALHRLRGDRRSRRDDGAQHLHAARS